MVKSITIDTVQIQDPNDPGKTVFVDKYEAERAAEEGRLKASLRRLRNAVTKDKKGQTR